MAISAHSEAAVVGSGDASLASRKKFRVFERAKIATRNWETAPGKELFLTGERAVILERIAEATLATDTGAACSGRVHRWQHSVVVHDDPPPVLPGRGPR